MKNPRLALLYSLLLPGLGQLYLGERAKGWTFVCMDMGVAVSLIVSHTWISFFLMGGIYLAILIPAALDAFQSASGRPRNFSAPIPVYQNDMEAGTVHVTLHEKTSQTWPGDTIPYVIVMLFIVGPFAIPLLWQSQKFSMKAKIAWTVAVILIGLVTIAIITLSASFLDQLMKQAGSACPVFLQESF